MNSTNHTDGVLALWAQELLTQWQKCPPAKRIESINATTRFKTVQHGCATSLTNGCKLTEARLAVIHKKALDWYPMSKRIYKVTVNGATRLIRAATPAAARSHAAKSTIQVAVATGEELYELGKGGLEIEDASEPVQQADVAESAGA